MFKILFMFALLGVSLTSLADTDQQHFDAGNQALEAKDYTSAKQHYYTCAKSRPGCMTQMGVTNYREGNREEAIEWFTLAARFGDETASGNLAKIGEPVPEADLLEKLSAKTEESEFGIMQILGAIGHGISQNAARRRLNCDSIIIGDVIDTECR